MFRVHARAPVDMCALYLRIFSFLFQTPLYMPMPMQAYGDLAGASTIEFGLQGSSWVWGGWRLDALAAAGCVDAQEGVALDELSLAAGPARLHAAGSLLCPRQDAVLRLTDFPLDLLQPLYRALPALQGAAADADARAKQGGTASYLRPLSGASKCDAHTRCTHASKA